MKKETKNRVKSIIKKTIGPALVLITCVVAVVSLGACTDKEQTNKETSSTGLNQSIVLENTGNEFDKGQMFIATKSAEVETTIVKNSEESKEPCTIERLENNNYVFKNGEGEIVGPEYSMIKELEDGTYRALKVVTPKDNRWETIDEYGERVEIGLIQRSAYKNGVAVACLENGRYSLINLEGEPVFESFAGYDGFNNDVVSIKLDNGKYGFMRTNGERFGGEYANAYTFNNDGFALVKLDDGAYTFINTEGEMVGTKYKDYVNSSIGKEYSIVTYLNGDIGFIDRNREPVEGRYKSILQDEVDYSIVQKQNDKFIVLNADKQPVSAEFDFIMKYNDSSDYTVAKDDWLNGQEGELYTLNKKGELCFSAYKNFLGFSDGIGVVQLKNGKYGFVDENEKLISSEYSDVIRFENGVAAVKLENGKWRMIDKDFNYISEEYDNVKMEADGHYVMSGEGKYEKFEQEAPSLSESAELKEEIYKKLYVDGKSL